MDTGLRTPLAAVYSILDRGGIVAQLGGVDAHIHGQVTVAPSFPQGNSLNMTTTPNILYPLARDESGRMVLVKDAVNRRSYQCLGCFQPMLAKRGKVRTWHFAHKPPQLQPCDSDNALHETAKALVMTGFRDALERQSDYYFGCLCSDCECPVRKNVAEPGASIESEAAIVAGTRSDLAVTNISGSKVIIEIVVTHDLETATLEAYLESGIPVLKVRPDWETLDELRFAAIAFEVLNIATVLCSSCKAERRREEERLKREEAYLKIEHCKKEALLKSVYEKMARLDEGRPSNPDKLPFQPWTHDRFNNPMFPRVRKQVYASAIVLVELGFIQARDKPWLFRFPLIRQGVIFADFGGNEDAPIWKYPGASIYAYNLGFSDSGCDCPAHAPEQYQIVEQVEVKSRAAGVVLRQDYLDSGTSQGSRHVGVNSTGRVNRQVLSELLAVAERMFPEEQQRSVQTRQAKREEDNRKQAEREEAVLQMEAERILAKREAWDSRMEDARQQGARKRESESEEWAKFNEWYRSRKVGS